MMDPITPKELKEIDNAIEEDPDPFLQQMNRGDYLRRLRMLALQDEMERAEQLQEVFSGEEKKCEDVAVLSTQEEEVEVLSSGERMLNYTQYLAHQRYYDDLKHVDMHYINYGKFGDAAGDLIVEQRKALGKGGFCWDAAFILGEHVIAHQDEWNCRSANRSHENDQEMTTVLELGAGTGLCGLMVAKATSANVLLTDLPELLGLMKDNLQRNHPYQSNVEARTLQWGNKADYQGAPYNVILGADIVASLYDPVALAHTLYDLSGPDTKIYISSKSRLDKPHEEFDAEMNRLFDKCERVVPESRLRNPGVFVMEFGGKKKKL
jgi:hypothetical protein